MADAPAPDTVTEAVAYLESEGYVDDYTLCSDGICDATTGKTLPVEAAIVDHTFRFEGDSDPSDEAIVLGVRCPAWGRKGVIVSAYGPEADPEHTDLLVALTRPPES